MSISVRCQCGRTYRLPHTAGGKRLRCKSCQAMLTVPDSRASVVTPASSTDDGGNLDVLFDDDSIPPPLLPSPKRRQSPSRTVRDEEDRLVPESPRRRRRERRRPADEGHAAESQAGPSLAMFFFSVIVGAVLFFGPGIPLVAHFGTLCAGVIVANIGFIRCIAALAGKGLLRHHLPLLAAGFVLAGAAGAAIVRDILFGTIQLPDLT